MIDTGDECATLIFRLGQDEIVRLLHVAGRAGFGAVAPKVVIGFNKLRGKGELVDGANLTTDRAEFERVIREAARKSGLSVEDSEWEAKTVTDMLDGYQRGMRAEFARHGFAAGDWGVEVIDGTFDDPSGRGQESMIAQVKVTCPKDQVEVAKAISAIVSQRVSNEQAFDTLVMDCATAERVRAELHALEPRVPIEAVGTSAREDFVALTFPRAVRSQVDLLVESDVIGTVDPRDAQAVAVEIPAAELERLMSAIRQQRGAGAPGDVTPTRVLGANESDALTEPVFVLDTSKRGAEVATVYAAARDQGRLLNDIQKLGIRGRDGREIGSFRQLRADPRLYRDRFDSDMQKATDIARSLVDTTTKSHAPHFPNVRG